MKFVLLLVIAIGLCVGQEVSRACRDRYRSLNANLKKKWEVMLQYLERNGDGKISIGDVTSFRYMLLLDGSKFKNSASEMTEALLECIFPGDVPTEKFAKMEIMCRFDEQLRSDPQQVRKCRRKMYRAITIPTGPLRSLSFTDIKFAFDRHPDSLSRDTFVEFEVTARGTGMDETKANAAFDAIAGKTALNVSRERYIDAYVQYRTNESVTVDELPLFG